jgi:pyruvate/2-oxoglutarate dehydrogenase complex dihydrolipoamide acyltransferase (E2) component
MQALMPYLFPNRCDSEVYIYESIDVTNLLEELARIREDNPGLKITIFHCFITALAKTINNRPYLNRFISGRRLYQRNKLTFAFVIKTFFGDDAKEVVNILEVSEDMSLLENSERIYDSAKEIRAQGKGSVDGLLNLFTKAPRFSLKMLIVCFGFLDYHGWMPKSICIEDPNYSSVLISNLGSIQCNACYHHLNNYGNNSLMVTVGTVRQEVVLNKEGKEELRSFCDFGVTLDERIADGFYFAKSVKLLKYMIANPKLLLAPIKEMIDYE